MEDVKPSGNGKGNRRRFFIYATIVTLAGGLAAGLGLKAFAHGSHGGWHRGGGFMSGSLDPAKVDARLERMLKHLYVEIDATDAQKQKLAPIVKDAVRDLLPLRQKLQDARKQAVALLAAERVDRDAIERLRTGQLTLADQASARFARALADVAEVLTPAQRTQLSERVAKHRRHRG